MNKQLVIIGIVAIIVIVELSGCNEQKTGNTNENVNENIISPTITSFNVTPNIINKGETAELRWVVTNATSVFINNGIGGVALSGNWIISPLETTVFILTASNSGLQTAATTQITVKNDKNTSGGGGPTNTPNMAFNKQTTPNKGLTLVIADPGLRWDQFTITGASNPGGDVTAGQFLALWTNSTTITIVYKPTNTLIGTWTWAY
jgi:hypothetical protein